MSNVHDESNLEYVIQMSYKPDEALFTHIAVTYLLACMKGDAIVAMRQLEFASLLLEEYNDDPEYMRPAFDRLRGLLAKGHPQIEDCSKSGKHCLCDSLFCCLCGKPKIIFTMEGEVNG